MLFILDFGGVLLGIITWFLAIVELLQQLLDLKAEYHE